MKFVEHHSTNMILRANNIPNCADLPATRLINDATGEMTISSFWIPSTAELKMLNEGGGVMLTVYSSTHPPVRIDTAPVEGFKR